jgi:hypothetical protein
MADCKAKKPCGCEDTGLTTPTPCIHDTPECPDPPQCCEIFDSACILYNGLGNECLEVTTGQTVQEVLDIIMTKVATLACVSCPVVTIPANNATDIELLPTLTWGASPGATSYTVYFGTDPLALAPISIGQAGTSYTFVTPNELTVGTVYYWSVTASNATADSGPCAPITFTTIGVDCTNPINVFLDNVKSLVTEREEQMLRHQVTYADATTTVLTNIQTGYADATATVLTDGITTSSCEVCCPDCVETNRYFLGGIDMWELYSNVVYDIQSCPPPCCVNKQLSLANLITFTQNNAIIGTPPGGCCDDFTSCLNELNAFLGSTGGELIEESSFKDSSGLCAINAWRLANPSVLPADVASIIFVILLQGLVIHCLPDGTIIIAGAATYNNWYTTTAQTCYTPIL